MNEKLTAYALNELPPDERAELEAQMQTDPSLQAQAEEMKSFCHLLNQQVLKHPADEFSQEQRAEVLSSLDKESKIIRPSFFRTPFWVSSAAVAACLAILLVKNWDKMEQYQDHSSVVRENDPSLKELATLINDKKKDVAQIPSSEIKSELRREQVAAEAPMSMQRKTAASSSHPIALPEYAEATDPLGQIPMPLAAPMGQISTSDTTPAAPDGLIAYGGTAGTGEGAQMETASRELNFRNQHPQTAPMELPNKSTARKNTTRTGVGAGVGSVTTTPASEMPPANMAKDNEYLAATRDHTRASMLNEVNKAWEDPAPADGFISSPAAPSSPALQLDALDESQALTGKRSTLLADLPVAGQLFQSGNEKYQPIVENAFQPAVQQPLSTFSVHTDGASYANARRFLNDGQRPPADAVRIEELINYFPYDYEQPVDEHPFAVSVTITEAPWQPLHRLARIAIKGREVHQDRGPANLVFLVDVSGSMNSPHKLPLVKQSLRLLTGQLRDTDRVALVTYAGNSRLVLESTEVRHKEKILSAIEALNAGGSTNGAGGIRLAYEQAGASFNADGINRVVLCSDGDFNVGISDPKELEKLISEKAKGKVFLSVLGFGSGNLNDRIMETLATKGNGNHAYIDSLSEARKVLVEQVDGTLLTIAKDVKIQVEFNPAQVASYRLIGYENRALAKEDFNNDKKDAGEIGAGHSVTALYEIVPADLKHPNGQPLVDDLKYAPPAAPAEPKPQAQANPESMTVKLRYKQPDADVSKLLEVPVTDKGGKLADAPQDFQFTASVAGFGLLLRSSPHAGETSWDMVRELALKGKGPDPLGYRGEFIQLIEKARGLSGSR